MSWLSVNLSWLQKLVLEQLITKFVFDTPIFISLKSGKYKVVISKIED